MLSHIHYPEPDLSFLTVFQTHGVRLVSLPSVSSSYEKPRGSKRYLSTGLYLPISIQKMCFGEGRLT